MLKKSNSLSVLIVDDNPMVRSDLSTLLSLIKGIEVIGEADDHPSTLKMVLENKPELILLDLQLNTICDVELDGLDLIPRIKQVLPGCLVYVLTVHGYTSARLKAMHAGADAFFVKGQDQQELFESISKKVNSRKYKEGEKK